MLDYNAVMEALAADADMLGIGGEGTSVADAQKLLVDLTTWLRPSIPVLADTAEMLNATYLMSLEASGIHIDPEDLGFHVLSVLTTLLAKLVRTGAMALPSC